MDLIKPQNIIVLDNGAFSIKAGFNGSRLPVRSIPNCVSLCGSTLLVGDQLSNILEPGRLLRFPYERGFLMSKLVQCEVWKRVFGPGVLNINSFSNKTIIITEPLFNPPACRAKMLSAIFDDFGFYSALLVSPPSASLVGAKLFAHARQIRSLSSSTPSLSNPKHLIENFVDGRFHLLVDVGYSHVYAVPMCDGVPILNAVRRMDVGGKVLTIYLRECISFRQHEMFSEFFLVDDIKQKMCFVSQNFKRDLETCKKRTASPEEPAKEGEEVNTMVADYLIRSRHTGPMDPSATTFDPSRSIRMNIERVSVPEVLFHPSDIGFEQNGIATAVLEALAQCHPSVRSAMLENIVLVGGSCKFPGFVARLMQELRSEVPDHCDINIYIPDSSELCAYRGLCSASGLSLLGKGEWSNLVTLDEWKRSNGDVEADAG